MVRGIGSGGIWGKAEILAHGEGYLVATKPWGMRGLTMLGIMGLGIAVILALYVIMSSVSFGLYGWDKRNAVRRLSRMPERTLLLVDALGGWPGGLAGQQVFRHKRAKGAYMVRFWMIVAIHAIGLGWALARGLAIL